MHSRWRHNGEKKHGFVRFMHTDITQVNGMAFIKPPSFDFQNWPTGWKWEDGVSEAADRLYERNPGTIEPSSDGKYYDNAVYDVLQMVRWCGLERGLHKRRARREVSNLLLPSDEHR